jgi:RimJ/RimL family protein N-acetyltransferase
MGRNCRGEGGNRIVRVGNVIFGADREVAQWIGRHIPAYQPDAGAKTLAVIHGNKIAAAIAFERFNGKNIEASIAAELSGVWANRRTLKTIFAYPFQQLNVECVTVLVASTNLKSLNLATKLGFEPQAYVRFAAHDGSTLIVLQMYKGKCRWLDNGQGKQRAGGPGPI